MVVFGPAIARLRSAKYLSLSLKRQGILAALQASHFASGDGWRHLIFLRRLLREKKGQEWDRGRGEKTDQLSQEVTRRGRFLWPVLCWGDSMMNWKESSMTEIGIRWSMGGSYIPSPQQRCHTRNSGPKTENAQVKTQPAILHPDPISPTSSARNQPNTPKHHPNPLRAPPPVSSRVDLSVSRLAALPADRPIRTCSLTLSC